MSPKTKVWVLSGIVAVLAIGATWRIVRHRDESSHKPAAVASAPEKEKSETQGSSAAPAEAASSPSTHSVQGAHPSAQQMAAAANNRVGVLTNTVANLDNYRSVAETSVTFEFNRDILTPQAKDALDEIAGSISSTKGYIITLESSTDSVGSAEYNDDLSHRRANSVIQYLASKYNVPAYKIYVIELGKDKPVESNKTKRGRADNRRVDVRLMTNTVSDTRGISAASPEPHHQIEKGQTSDEVIAAIGQPDKIVNLGAKQIFVYKGLKVTFLNGRVSDVQ
jgi:outer membrane protein OmpA-like peptidoglycan-associated protein